MRRLRNEPLVHFCVLGLLLFGAHRLLLSRSRHKIVLSPAFVAHTSDLDRYVDEEVLYREALALGLDRGDLIVRRRLVQKMEWILRGAPGEPTEPQLQRFLDAHAERYDAPARVSFHHVFTRGDVDSLAQELKGGGDWQKLGEPFVPGRSWSARSEKELAAVFGDDAARTIMSAGEWTRVDSRFGKHLVFIDERIPPRRPSLGEIHSRVREDWLAQERSRLDREALAELRSRYTVEPR